MTLPARRITPLPISQGSRVIEYRLYPSAHTAGCFRLTLPHRFEDLHDEVRVNVADRQPAQYREGISVKGAVPLGRVFRVAPLHFVRGDVSLSAGTESGGVGGRHGTPTTLDTPRLDRIDPISQLFPASQCGVARVSERYGVERPQPHIAGAAIAGEPEYPRPCARRRHLKVQTVAVRVQPRRSYLGNKDRRKPVDRTRQCTNPRFNPCCITGYWRTLTDVSRRKSHFSAYFLAFLGRPRTQGNRKMAEREGFEPSKRC